MHRVVHVLSWWLPSNSVAWQKLYTMAVSVTEDIDELKRRIALLDGDKKAYSENSQWSIKKKKERISCLRAENKQLRTTLAKRMEADDDVIARVFQAHNSSTPAELRGLTGDTAVRKFDQTVCELIKQRNALQHVKRSQKQKFASLEIQLKQMDSEAETINSTPSGNSEDAQTLRMLENRLDKVVIKCNEAAHIRKTYEAILEKLQEERLGFDNQIAALEKAIKTRRKDLKDLESLHTDAQLARDTAKTELAHQEQSMAESRRNREKKLSELRKEADEKKEFAEKVERRLMRRPSTMQSTGHLDVGANALHEAQVAKITSYEEALAKIKDATGVSDIQEVVDRFLNQGDTKRHLEQLEEENTKTLSRLKEDKEKLQEQFEDMKYSGEAKMSTGQRMLEDFESHLDEAKATCKDSKEKADRASKLLAQVKNGVDHLSEKLQHIKAPHTHVLKPKLDPNSEEFVLEQLGNSEQKLVSLAEELSSRDLETIHKEMEDEEFRHTVEGGVSANVKLDLPKVGSKTLYDEDSGSDEEFVSRDVMKRMTTQLVESKTKKKTQDDDDEEDSKKKKKRR